MADKLLKIDLHIDASNARVASAAIRADLKRTEVEAGKLALAQEQAAKRGADAQVREQRRVTMATEKEAKEQAAATKRATKEQAEAARESSEQMMATLRTGGTAALAALTAAGKATIAVMQAGVEKSRELSQEVIKQRDALRGIAAIAGKPNDDVFLKENLDFRAQTGMTGAEAHAFREEFIGSGELSKGKTITPEEYAKYEQQLARFGVAKGSSPGGIGEFGGSVLRFKDYNKGGAREAMADVGISYDVLARGKGKQDVMQAQLSKLSSAYVNEDAMKGSFRDVGDAAAALSIGAEVAPESSGDVVMQALRGLRSFHKKQGGALKSMGIKHGEEFDVSMEKLSERLDKETAGGKSSAQAMEDMGFNQFEESRSLLAFYNNRKLLRDQLKYKRENRDPDKVESDVGGAYGGKAIRDRQAQQRVEREQALKGISGEELVILRKNVRADLERSGEIGTPQADATNYMGGLMGGSILAGAGGKEYGEQLLIDKEVKRRLGRRVGSGEKNTWMPQVAGAMFGAMPGIGPVANAAGAWGDQFIRRSMGEDEANLQEGANAAAGGGLNQATQQRQLDVLERIERNTGGATAPLTAAPRGNQPTQAR